MFGKETNQKKRKTKAIESGDPNRILWLFDRAAARVLFQHSLNAETASKLSEIDLLKLKGVGPKILRSIRMATETVKK